MLYTWQVLLSGNAIVQKSLSVVLSPRLFHLLTVGSLSINRAVNEPAMKAGWPTHPGNECSAIPTLSPVSTFHIQYYTNAEPLHSHHISPRCLFQLPLDSRFSFFLPPQHKMRPTTRHSGTEKVWLGFLCALIYCQCRANWQKERGRERRRSSWGWGVIQYNQQIKDPSINQAVTTRCLVNWIVPGSPERVQTLLSFIELLNQKRRTLTFKGTFSRLREEELMLWLRLYAL